MQTLTKTEVSWMVKEFEQQSAAMAREAKQEGTALKFPIAIYRCLWYYYISY